MAIDDNYMHYVPAINLSIEKNTKRVPQDNKYHVVREGQIVGSHRYKKNAEKQFYELLQASGYKPASNDTENTNPLKESVDNYIQSKTLFWTEGPIRNKRG